MFLVIGCKKREEPSIKEITLINSKQELSIKLDYFKDRYGICYAVSEQWVRGHYIYLFTSVPCDKVAL